MDESPSNFYWGSIRVQQFVCKKVIKISMTTKAAKQDRKSPCTPSRSSDDGKGVGQRVGQFVEIGQVDGKGNVVAVEVEVEVLVIKPPHHKNKSNWDRNEKYLRHAGTTEEVFLIRETTFSFAANEMVTPSPTLHVPQSVFFSQERLCCARSPHPTLHCILNGLISPALRP